jgi:hypothetical protein
MNPPSEDHSTVTDDTQDWIVEKFQLGRIKAQRCSSGWQVDDLGDDALEIVGEGCRISHDAMLRFPQRVHLLIASILIVPGDEFRMLDELRGVAGNSRDQDLSEGGVSRHANYGLL